MCDWEEFEIVQTVEDSLLQVCFKVTEDEELYFFTETGSTTQFIDNLKSGWSFQDSEFQELYEEFLETLKDMDLVELSCDMEVGEIIDVPHHMRLRRNA